MVSDLQCYYVTLTILRAVTRNAIKLLCISYQLLEVKLLLNLKSQNWKTGKKSGKLDQASIFHRQRTSSTFYTRQKDAGNKNELNQPLHIIVGFISFAMALPALVSSASHNYMLTNLSPSRSFSCQRYKKFTPIIFTTKSALMVKISGFIVCLFCISLRSVYS